MKTSSPQKEKIYNLLHDHQPIAAMAYFHKLINAEPAADISSRFASLMQTFRFLTRFFVEGSDDPKRDSMLASIRAQFVDMLEEYFYLRNFDTDTSQRGGVARILRGRGTTLTGALASYSKPALEYEIMKETGQADLQIMQAREKALREIFDTIWTSVAVSRHDADTILSMLDTSTPDHTLAAMVTGALMLSLIENPVSSKMKLLLRIYDTATDDRIAARAMTAVVVVLARWGETAVGDPEVRAMLETWQDSLLAYSRVREVTMALVRAFDTERISTLLRSNVMPELMKLQPRIRKLMTDKPSAEAILEGYNPEWEEMLHKSSIGEKLQQMSEIQKDGGDIMMDTFSSLKSDAFFREISHWFLPFEQFRSEFKSQVDFVASLTSVTDNSALICDSDKYSLALAIHRIPTQMLEGMKADLAAQMQQAGQEALDALSDSGVGFSAEVKNVVKCLYRFYRLYSRKEEFHDIFAEPVLPDRLPVVGESLFDSDFKKLIYEFFFRNGYHTLALPYLESRAAEENDDAVTYQKIGFCYQKLGDYPSAIEAYRKAEILDSRNNWLRESIAWCNMELGNFEAAAKFYQEALANDPDSISLLRKTGAALLAAGDPDKALAHFYKVYYLEPSEELSDAIGWAEFMRGDYEKALEYELRAIEADKGGTVPYIRAGHACMAMGKIADARRYYTEALKHSPKALEDVWEDRLILEKAGIKPAELELILQYAFWQDHWPLLTRD